MIEKKCFKCGRTLPITEFYTHPGMKDGYLNKCKDCHHEDCRKHRIKLSQDPSYVARERERSREKDKKRKGRTSDHFTRNTQRDLKVRGINANGFEAHHWNYNLRRSVFLLSKRAHHCIHAMTSVNKDDGYTYTKDGRRINSEQEAFSEYVYILARYNIYEPPILVNY